MTADTRPLDNAVKNPDEAMLKPLNKKLKANIRKPDEASANVPASCVNTDTIGVDRRIECVKLFL